MSALMRRFSGCAGDGRAATSIIAVAGRHRANGDVHGMDTDQSLHGPLPFAFARHRTPDVHRAACYFDGEVAGIDTNGRKTVQKLVTDGLIAVVHEVLRRCQN